MAKRVVQPRALGGSFAPPLTAEKIAAYKVLAEGLPAGQVRDVMLALCKMAEVFHETPESDLPAKELPGSPFVSGERKFRAFGTPLSPAEVKRIWDHVPWEAEIKMYRGLAKSLTGDVCNAFYHLIWYAEELSKDREPITQDKLVDVE